MALDTAQFSKVQNLNPKDKLSPTRALFAYYAGADNLATIKAAGYFNSIRDLVKVGDFVLVIGATGTQGRLMRFATVPAATDVTVAGVESVARGQFTTVTASDTLVTGLTGVALVVATLDSDPVAGCQSVTASIGDQAGAPAAGSVLIKTWKATAAGDTALIPATTFGKKVNWIAYAVASLG